MTINGVNCKPVDNEYDVYFDMALTMLEEIIYHNDRGEQTVMIVPVGPTAQYPILAEMVNRLGVSLKKVHFIWTNILYLRKKLSNTPTL